MNRSQRAAIRAAHNELDMAREFKNDALYEDVKNYTGFFSSKSDRFESEKQIFKGKQKALRRLKKYNGPTGYMSESEYMELMGA